MALATRGKMQQIVRKRSWLVTEIPGRPLVEDKRRCGEVLANFVRAGMIVGPQPLEAPVLPLAIDSVATTTEFAFIVTNLDLSGDSTSPGEKPPLERARVEAKYPVAGLGA